ncbi:MAG TPA: formimidoylglutamate deiminase [Thermoleophilaceae bacterium]|nr:formimidoylglutamate deiminase [Thermoleophilaceae bacterium]
MTAYWCALAWLGGECAESGVLVEVEGSAITSVTPGEDSPPRDATILDGLTLPGLANAHSHAFQRALRGRTQRGRGTFWTWREEMYRAAGRIEPDTYLALARATYAEMAMAGITTVGEFHYVHHTPSGAPYDDPNEMGRVLLAAAAQAGVRITLIDACYLHGGIDAPLEEGQRRFSDGSAEAWAERVDDLDESGSVRVGAAIHSMRAVDPDSAATVAAWAREHDRPLHAHVSEQPAENEACRDAYGRTPTGLLADAGALDASFTAIHGTHLDAADVAMLGEAGSCCCVCPTTERDLADGIGRMRPLVDAGVRLAFGSDSHAVIDPFEEARAVELDERLATGERGNHGAVELLRAATAGGHACLGWPEAGRIGPGAPADLVTVALDGVRLAGYDADTVLDAVVFGATAADVRSVLVDGVQVVRDGRHGIAPSELHEAIRAVTG